MILNKENMKKLVVLNKILIMNEDFLKMMNTDTEDYLKMLNTNNEDL